MSQMRVFLSHSSQDKAFADALARALRGTGADVWYDEHNLGTGQLLDVIQRELQTREVFIVMLSKVAMASDWVRDECRWAYTLFKRDPKRIILPVVAQPLDQGDFNALLFLEDFKRIAGPNDRPYTIEETIERTLQALALRQPPELQVKDLQQWSGVTGELSDQVTALAEQNRKDEALALVERVTQTDPENTTAWLLLANISFSFGHPLEAAVAAERAARSRPNEWQVQMAAAYSLASFGRSEEALEVLERALAIKPSEVALHVFKSVLLRVMKRYAEALVAVEKALTLAPNDAGAWSEKGAVLSALGSHARAVDAYDHALAIDSSRAHDWYEKSLQLLVERHQKEALDAAEKALTVDPTLQEAWSLKAILLRNQGREAEANEAERRAKEIHS